MQLDSFRTWAENNNIFGFQPADPPEPDNPNEGLPIRQFAMSRMLERLAKQKIGGREGKLSVPDEIKWGQGVGQIKINITPNWRVLIFRQLRDREGNVAWITKRTFAIDTDRFPGKKESVAYDVFDLIKQIASEPIERADMDGKWEGMKGFVKALVDRCKTWKSELFHFRDVNYISENNAIIRFNVKGSGVGKLVTRADAGTAVSMLFDVSYSPTTGLIRIMFTNVADEGESASWEMDWPSLDVYFSPAQPREEIIRTLITWVKHY